MYPLIIENIRQKALNCGRKPEEISLVVASKGRDSSAIETVYNQGARNFGESRVTEALEKIQRLPNDCRWHFIGTLQSNKIAKVLGKFSLLHGIDSLLLAKKISEASEKREMTTSVLLQVNTSGEQTKHGLSPEDWLRLLDEINLLSHIKVEGLMTMAPFTADESLIRGSFSKLYQLRETWKQQMKEPLSFTHLSMGMSHDYLLAIEEGATLLRIGSAIF